MSLPRITDVLPHRAPMLLLDELDLAGDDVVVCTVKLRAGSPFVEDGRVGAHVSLEYMAQAVAAYAGVRSLAAGGPVRIGYLVGARDVTFAVDWLSVGDDLRVEARHVWGDDALGSFDCQVSRGDEIVAKGSLSVYLGPRESTGA